MTDISQMASLTPPAGRAWDSILALVAMLIATVVDHLDLITKLTALTVLLITVWEKPTVQGWFWRARRKPTAKETTDEIG